MANPNIVNVTGITAGSLGWNLPTGGMVNLIDPDSGYLLKINRIVCANVDGSAAADLNLYIDGMGTGAANGLTPTGASATTYLAKTISIPADASLVVSDTPIYMMEGDILKGGASDTGDLELFISYEVLDD